MPIEDDDDLARFLAEIHALMAKRVGSDNEGDFTARCVKSARNRGKEKYAARPQELNSEESKRWLQDLVEEVFVDELISLLPPDRGRSTERPSPSELDPYLDRLFRAYEPEIRSLLARHLKKPRDDTDVDECVARTFKNVVNALCNKSLEEIRQLRHTRLYCMDTARTVFLKFIREIKLRQAEKSLEEEHPEEICQANAEGPEKEVIKAMEAQEIRDCLDLLSQDYKDPLCLHYLENKASPEIAKQLGWPGQGGAVRVRIQIDRGLGWLRKYLEIKRIFEQPITVEESKDIQEYIRTFSSFPETVLRFHFVDHWSIASIVAHLRCPEENIRGSLFRSVTQLHNYVEVKRALEANPRLDMQSLSESDRFIVRAHFLEHRPLEYIALECHSKEKPVIASLRRGVRILHRQLHAATKRVRENRNEERE